MAEIIKPPKLKKGDIIGVIAPSNPIAYKQEVTYGMKILEGLGFQPKLSPKALEVHGNYQAGTREDRLSDFHQMFAVDEVKGIFCASGGYSSIQLLQDIDWDLIKKNPKVFLGYSDITTLLNAIYTKTGLITFHSPNVESLDSPRTKGGKYTVENLKQILMKGNPQKYASYTEWKTLKPGRAEGDLIGGNLNVLTSLLGTPYEPKWDGKILFWEEVDATIEEIDNYLWRLRVAKVFKKIEGMVVGKITNIETMEAEDDYRRALDKPLTLENVIQHATEGFNFPILYGVDFGHEVPSITIPIGAEAKIDCPAPRRVGSFAITEKYLSEGEE
jgi:muramoyltetrapeptide carboxypeptidase